MVCLDSDFLLAYLQNNPDAIKKLENLHSKGDTAVYTTTVNAFELFKGVYRTRDKQKEIIKVKSVLDALELLPLDYESARRAGELDASIKSSTIGESDLLIASIAVTNKQTLITRNIKHFERVPGLTVESW